MRRVLLIVTIMIAILFVCTLGYILILSTAHIETKALSNPSMPLPDINTFSSTEYDKTLYRFPKIKSAVLIREGISETLDPEDPRLIRLLNSLSFSYEQGYTAWRQGHVEEEEFLAFINSNCSMIDIYFEQDESCVNDNEFSKTPRAIVSANRYFLLVDTKNSAWMPENSIYANEHIPYAEILSRYYKNLSDEELGEIYGDIEWGNNKWIDLLAYAGFE